jgi:hypothetical protein
LSREEPNKVELLFFCWSWVASWAKGMRFHNDVVIVVGVAIA